MLFSFLYRIRNLTLAALLLGLCMGTAHAQTAGITGISPSRLRPGTIVELTGSGFGSAPFEGTQVCFADNLCTTSGNFSTFVRSWSDSAISVLVPYQDFPTNGKISLVLPTPSGGMILESPTYTFSKMDPAVSQTSTKVITPGSTDLVISGQNFLGFTAGKSTICIENNCLTDTQLGTNIISWSDTSIVVRLPYVAGLNTFTVNVVVYDPLLENIPGANSVRIVPVSGFHYELPPLPLIATISPTDVYPGTTSIVLTGTGFGSEYQAGNNQICFGSRCLTDGGDIPLLLQSWTPTRIEFKAPLWLTVASTPTDTVSIRVFDPVEQRYMFIEAATKIVIRPVPVITETVPLMEMGGSYMLRGRNFGSTMGQLTLNGVSLDVRSWTDTSVIFWIGDNVQSGKLRLLSSAGLTSQEVTVSIQPKAVYSKDEFTKLMWYFGTLGIQEAWAKTKGTPDVVVAVLDSGVDFGHEDLAGKSWVNTREIPGNNKDDDQNGFIDDVAGWDFVKDKPTGTPLNNHGTMVASVIAAESDNFKGLAGVAPGARIMNLQVTTAADANFNEDYITLQSAQKGIKYAVDNGADIINLSFASETDTAPYKDIIAYAYAHNVLVVVASGNDGKDLNKTKYSPVCDDGAKSYALGVSSVGPTNGVSSFANRGSACIDLFAPGEKIVVGAPDPGATGKYMLAEGTSFAAPLVSGAAALLRSIHPDWNVAEVRAALVNSAILQNGLPLLAVGRSANISKPQVIFTPDLNATGSVTEGPVIFHSDPIPVAPVTPDSSSDTQTTPNPVINVDPTEAPARSFSDIPKTSAFYIPVTELSREGVIQGYSDGSYRPLTPVNRAEFLKILVEGASITPDATKYRNCFPDVTTQWFAPYVCYAKEQGVVEGYPGALDKNGNRLFLPDKTINKVEALKVILSYNKVPLAKGKNSYNDADPSAWYYAYVTTAEQLSLLDERFSLRPGDALTRGVMAQVIYRLSASLAARAGT